MMFASITKQNRFVSLLIVLSYHTIFRMSRDFFNNFMLKFYKIML